MKYFTAVVCLFWLQPAFSQTAVSPTLFNFEKSELRSHLMYLASDELAGRRTTSAGGEKAAEYIADAFKTYGVKTMDGLNGYFQPIPFDDVKPPKTGSLTIGETVYSLQDNLLIMNGKKAEFTAPVVFAGHGWVDKTAGVDDYKDLDVKGKIVLVLPGSSEDQGAMEVFKAMKEKQQFAGERGAVGLFELFRMNFPWQFFSSYFGKARLEISNTDESVANDLVYGWIKESTPNPVPAIEKGEETMAALSTSGIEFKKLQAANVVGWVEGTDEELKNEYVVLSAHYDHVGVGKQGGAPYSDQDSIFNGARDNGMGTVALLAAAKSLAANPPKRSVIFLACTGEEMGMLGSAWFTEHPVVPLDQMVFNLNNDGAGYNSTSHITVIGLKRTNMDTKLKEGAEANQLHLTGDPAPDQNLYERSDNISFALKGIPAIDIAPGITEMNEAVFQYYHQATDNPETVDYDYLLRFSQAYSSMARLIANSKEKPSWTPGDKFEKQ